MGFCTRYNYFKYHVMYFGLFNTPTSFQGYINKILTNKLNIVIVVYLDDILIYTKDLNQPNVDAIQ